MRGILAAFMVASLSLAGCSDDADTIAVHVAGPVPDLEAALQAWSVASQGTFQRGGSAMLGDHDAVLDADGVVALTQDTFGHSDRGWYVVLVQARAPDPWVLSWAIHPEPIIVVFLPAVQDTADALAGLGHHTEAATIAQWAMLHAGGHLLGRVGCGPGSACGIMDPAYSHGILLLDLVRADSLSPPSFPSLPEAPSSTVRRPV